MTRVQDLHGVRNIEPMYMRQAKYRAMHGVPLTSASSDFSSCYFAFLDLKNAVQNQIAVLFWKHPAVHG